MSAITAYSMSEVARDIGLLPPLFAQGASVAFRKRFYRQLLELSTAVAAVLKDDLTAIVLGGGYGRGDGCLMQINGVESAYNDVDLFLVTKHSRLHHVEALEHIRETSERRLGVSVDFSRPQTERMIRNWPRHLMWQDLLDGHVVLYGPQDILTRNAPARLRTGLPLVEASRLLLNRGAGLLWASLVEQGELVSPDPSFVARNYFKAAQACIDALLIAFDCYASRPAEKKCRLRLLASQHPIVSGTHAVEWLEVATSFRRAPGQKYGMKLKDLRRMASLWCEIFLWIEQRRLKCVFRDMRDYAAHRGLYEADDAALFAALRANLRLRRFGAGHPREDVYRVVPFALERLAVAIDFDVARTHGALACWKRVQSA